MITILRPLPLPPLLAGGILGLFARFFEIRDLNPFASTHHWQLANDHHSPTTPAATSSRGREIGFVRALFENGDLNRVASTGDSPLAADYYSPGTPRHSPPVTHHPLPVTDVVVRRGQRGQAVREPLPAGWWHSPTATLRKTEGDPTSTNGPSLVSMSPNRAIVSGKSDFSCRLAADRPLNIAR
jgi:hypothetical protein